jgi:hypothetical protein
VDPTLFLACSQRWPMLKLKKIVKAKKLKKKLAKK